MKKLMIAAAALALFAGPTLAQVTGPSNAPAQRQSGTAAGTTGSGVVQQQLPRLFTGQGVMKGNDVYDCTGKYLGSDPDASVRNQLYRQGDMSCQGN